MTVKKILTDMDGVLVDSEDVAMRVMDDWGVALIKRYQPDAQIAQDYIYKTYPGTSTDRIVDALIKEFDLPEALIRQDYNIDDKDDIALALADHVTIDTMACFTQQLKIVPGAADAYRALVTQYGADNVGLATTSRKDRMDVSLEHAVDPVTGANAGLAQMFPAGERRRSGYDFKNKYDEVFAALGWSTAETVVVEDSLSGVSKAKAGRNDVRVVGTVAAKFYEDKAAQAKALTDAGADIVISNIADLPKAVAWLDNGMNALAKPDFAGDVYVPSVDPGFPVSKPALYKPRA